MEKRHASDVMDGESNVLVMLMTRWHYIVAWIDLEACLLHVIILLYRIDYR